MNTTIIPAANGTDNGAILHMCEDAAVCGIDGTNATLCVGYAEALHVAERHLAHVIECYDLASGCVRSAVANQTLSGPRLEAAMQATFAAAIIEDRRYPMNGTAMQATFLGDAIAKLVGVTP